MRLIGFITTILLSLVVVTYVINIVERTIGREYEELERYGFEWRLWLWRDQSYTKHINRGIGEHYPTFGEITAVGLTVIYLIFLFVMLMIALGGLWF